MDRVIRLCNARSLEMRDARKCMDRKQWKDFVSSTNGSLNVQTTTEHTFDVNLLRNKLQFSSLNQCCPVQGFLSESIFD